jgi:hypothetical protein
MVSETRFFVLVKGGFSFLKVFNKKLPILKRKSGASNPRAFIEFCGMFVMQKKFLPERQ